MRSRAPDLWSLFRSRHQADILACLYLHPDDQYTATDLAKRFDVALTTVHREVQRLVEARLVHDRQVGRSRLYSAATDHRAAAALSQLLALTFGPQVVVEEAFADIEGVHSVHIYGSWAARYSGEPGRPPTDVDVMVVGNPSRADVYAAADAAQERLGLQVNPTVRTVDQWNDPTDALVAQSQASPLVTVYEEGVDG